MADYFGSNWSALTKNDSDWLLGSYVTACPYPTEVSTWQSRWGGKKRDPGNEVEWPVEKDEVW